MTLSHKTRLTLLGKVLKKTLFAINAIKIALIANRVFLKPSGQGFKKDPIRYQCYKDSIDSE